MASEAYLNGNHITCDDGEIWRYDDGTPSSEEVRPCTKCGLLPTEEGHDACLGTLKGVKHACCGHGKLLCGKFPEGYVILENGQEIRQKHVDDDIFSQFK